MSKLEKEDIQFIDTYLENSDIVFADIRMEMVDHVASGIEVKMSEGDTRDFYFIFKEYMVENKAKLLQGNNKFLKSADKKIWNALLKELMTPIMPLLFLASFFGFYMLHKHLSLEAFQNLVSMIPLLGLIGFLLMYVVYSHQKQLKRFSAVERLAWPFFVSYQISVIVLSFSKSAKEDSSTFWLIGGLSLALTFMLLLIRISLKLFKSYNERFKHIE